MEEVEKECEVCFPWWGTVFFVVLTLIFTWLITWGVTDNSWRSEAVSRGAAKWVIVDERGTVRFEWIPR